MVQQPVAPFDHTSRSYVDLLDSLKFRIQQARTKAALSVNRELVRLYWAIGHQIVEAQNREGWGTSMIDRLAHDLQSSLPSNRGLSPRNLWRMRAFYLAYPVSEASLPQPMAELAREFLPQAVAEIPWGHNIALIEKVKEPQQRLWYTERTIEHGWSRAVLVHQMESSLYERKGKPGDTNARSRWVRLLANNGELAISSEDPPVGGSSKQSSGLPVPWEFASANSDRNRVAVPQSCPYATPPRVSEAPSRRNSQATRSEIELPVAQTAAPP